jgi:hypothetical protein
MRAAVAGGSVIWPFRWRDTDVVDTPAASATSMIRTGLGKRLNSNFGIDT